jgi:hypothetical protein
MEIILGVALFALGCRLFYWIGFPRSWAVFGGLMFAPIAYFGIPRLLQNTATAATLAPPVVVIGGALLLSLAAALGFWLGRASLSASDSAP